jgi:hypothetical protein
VSEDTEKLEKTEPEASVAELSERDLEKVAGGFQKIVVVIVTGSTYTTDADSASPKLCQLQVVFCRGRQKLIKS